MSSRGEYGSGTIVMPRGFSEWKDQDIKMESPWDIADAYENKKLAGAFQIPEQHEKFLEEAKRDTGYAYLEDAAHDNGWADSGKGKLAIPFVHLAEAYPQAIPGPGQVVGDCVSHSQKNANLLSMVCEVVAGNPDQEHGKREMFPKVDLIGEKNGVMSTEAIYWHRGYDGHGWYCGASARVSRQLAGCVLRQDYPELGFDLTRYSGANIKLFGSRKPTRSVIDEHDDHLVRAAAEVRGAEGVRDALFNGYAISSCGMEGFERQRDKYGVSRRTTQWAHAMAYFAFDDRAEIVRKYGGPLVLVQNSWGVWNKGPRAIYDSAKYVPANKKQDWINKGIVDPGTGAILIPHGSFWARWSDVSRRECYVMSSVNGWPKQTIDWGNSLWG